MRKEKPICVVTGANAGIGKAAATQLAREGAVVILACRNLERGHAARDEIVAATANPAVDVMELDTSSLESVRAFVTAFEAKFDVLDVLINNAGNFDLAVKTPALTSENIEAIFATNYLGPWLLTNLLLERLRNGAPARVINVGSKGLIAFPTLGIELDNLDGAKKFNPARAYYLSKLCALSFTLELARRVEGSGVVVNMVRVPAVQVDLDRLPNVPGWQLGIYKLKRRFSITPADMAKTYVWLALSDDAEALNGTYVDEAQHAVGTPKRACDTEMATKLWDVSAALAGFEA